MLRSDDLPSYDQVINYGDSALPEYDRIQEFSMQSPTNYRSLREIKNKSLTSAKWHSRFNRITTNPVPTIEPSVKKKYDGTALLFLASFIIAGLLLFITLSIAFPNTYLNGNEHRNFVVI